MRVWSISPVSMLRWRYISHSHYSHSVYLPQAARLLHLLIPLGTSLLPGVLHLDSDPTGSVSVVEQHSCLIFWTASSSDWVLIPPEGLAPLQIIWAATEATVCSPFCLALYTQLSTNVFWFALRAPAPEVTVHIVYVNVSRLSIWVKQCFFFYYQYESIHYWTRMIALLTEFEQLLKYFCLIVSHKTIFSYMTPFLNEHFRLVYMLSVNALDLDYRLALKDTPYQIVVCGLHGAKAFSEITMWM